MTRGLARLESGGLCPARLGWNGKNFGRLGLARLEWVQLYYAGLSWKELGWVKMGSPGVGLDQSSSPRRCGIRWAGFGTAGLGCTWLRLALLGWVLLELS